MRDICRRRQKETSALKKTKWSLYEKEHLDKLLNDIQQLVKDLVELFPAIVPFEKSLCNQEATEMQNETSLPSLQENAAMHDKLLEEAIAKLDKHKVSDPRGLPDFADALLTATGHYQ